MIPKGGKNAQDPLPHKCSRPPYPVIPYSPPRFLGPFFVQKHPLGGIPDFWSHFFYKTTEIPHSLFLAIFLQTEHLGEICKIHFIGHFFTRSPSSSNPTFLVSIFLSKNTEIAHNLFQAIFVQTHSK